MDPQQGPNPHNHIKGVVYTVWRGYVDAMGDFPVFKVQGTNGYKSWATTVKVAKHLAEENAGVRVPTVRMFHA
jgi:hypothetical protein